MTPLIRRIAFTGVMVVVAGVAASAGVLLWRHLNPPAIQVTSLPQPASGAAIESSPEPVPDLAVGDRRPDFTLADTDGRVRSVAEWDGKLLFVNFWATWCPPCLEEIPGFMRLQADHAGQGVQFLGVALDNPENVRAFMAKHAVNYPSLHGERDAIALGRRYGNRIGALPYTVVVGRDGRILRMHQGVLAEEEARAIIEGAE